VISYHAPTSYFKSNSILRRYVPTLCKKGNTDEPGKIIQIDGWDTRMAKGKGPVGKGKSRI
jgi:hypothetical protein